MHKTGIAQAQERDETTSTNIRWGAIILIMVYCVLVAALDRTAVFVMNCFLMLAFALFTTNKGKNVVPKGCWLLLGLSFSPIIGAATFGFSHGFIRDAFYYTSPFLFWFIGCNVGMRLKSEDELASALYMSSCAIALYILIRGITTGSLRDEQLFSSIFSPNEFMITAIAIYIFRPQEWTLPKKHRIICFFGFVLTVLTVALTLSRTTMLSLSIVMLILTLTTNNDKRSKYRLIVSLLLTIIVLLVIVPDSVLDWFIAKLLRSVTEISGIGSSWDNTSIVRDWRGYEIACAQKQFIESDLFGKLFGAGFGSLLNMNGWEFLVTQEVGGIPSLHNGYYAVLVKCGLVGLLSLLMFYVANIIDGYHQLRESNNNFWTGLYFAFIVCVVVTTYVIAGLFTSTGMYYFVLPMAMIAAYRQSSHGNSTTRDNNKQALAISNGSYK